MMGADEEGSFCRRCQRRFRTPQRLLYHLKRVCRQDGPPPSPPPDPASPGYCTCPHCAQAFASKHRRRYHLATRCKGKKAGGGGGAPRGKGRQPVDRSAPGHCVCAHCGEEFSTRGRRKYHVLKHCARRGEAVAVARGRRPRGAGTGARRKGKVGGQGAGAGEGSGGAEVRQGAGGGVVPYLDTADSLPVAQYCGDLDTGALPVGQYLY